MTTQDFFYNFAKESMEKNGYVILSLEELNEIRNSAFPENHIIAAKFASSTNSLLLVRGDYKTVNVPIFNIPLIGLTAPPNFNILRIEDLGLTLVIDNSLKLDSTVLFDAIDDRFLERIAKK
jgi:hypothetical protein